MRIMRLFAFTLQAILIQCHLGGLQFNTNRKYLFKPIDALQELTDLWPLIGVVLTVVSLIPAPINGSTNWWDLSNNQVVVHMQGIYPTKLLFICKEFSRNPGQIKNRTVQGGSCKTNIAVSLDVISERGGWILHFTLHITCYTPHVVPLHKMLLYALGDICYTLHHPYYTSAKEGVGCPTLRYVTPHRAYKLSN